MTRGGHKKRQQDVIETGERRCLVQGERVERDSLIRFVLSPDDQVVPDILERLDGRGVWVRADRASLAEAVQKNLFSRGFKTKATVPIGLVDEIERQLTDRVISLIAMARRAGDAIAGAEKVAQALQNGEVLLLFQASDGSEREKRNLSYRNEVDLRYECLNRQELGMAFSKENVVHAAITGEGLVKRLETEASRLSLMRSASSPKD